MSHPLESGVNVLDFLVDEAAELIEELSGARFWFVLSLYAFHHVVELARHVLVDEARLGRRTGAVRLRYGKTLKVEP